MNSFETASLLPQLISFGVSVIIVVFIILVLISLHYKVTKIEKKLDDLTNLISK